MKPFPIYAAADPGTIVTALDGAESFAGLMADPRRNAVLIGPGPAFPPQRAAAWRKRWRRARRP